MPDGVIGSTTDSESVSEGSYPSWAVREVETVTENLERQVGRVLEYCYANKWDVELCWQHLVEERLPCKVVRFYNFVKSG